MPKSRSLKAISQTNSNKKGPKPSKKNQESVAAPSEFDETVVVKKLADNERKVREKALKVLSQHISTIKKLDSLKMQKLWKGLFFTVWHSDRPLTQQALAQELADLTKSVKDNNYWNFIDAFWVIMCREWHTIDKHRIDKFYMLIRRVVAANLEKLAQEGWSSYWVKSFTDLLAKYPLDPTDAKIPHALRLHICDILLDEFDKIEQKNDEFSIEPFMEPFLAFVEATLFKTVKLYAIDNVLRDPRLLETYGYTSKFTPVEKEEESSDSADDFDKTSDEEEDEGDDEGNDDEDEEFTGFD